MSTVVQNPSDDQEVFDYVVSALRKQNKKSLSGNNICLYRGPDGLKCAAGHLIPDDYYIPQMEGWSVHSCPELKNYFVNHGYNMKLISELQITHDSCPVSQWEKEFEEIAKNYNLVYTKVA